MIPLSVMFATNPGLPFTAPRGISLQLIIDNNRQDRAVFFIDAKYFLEQTF